MSVMVPILITGMGSTTAIAVSKGLRLSTTNTFHIHGTDVFPRQLTAGTKFCDTLHQVPKANEPGYMEALIQICARNSIKMLFPIVDIELTMISRHAEQFEKLGVYLWLSKRDVINVCNDKFETFKFFKAHDVATAESYLPEDELSSLAFPLIIKPRGGVSSIDVFKINSPDELRQALPKVYQPVIQDYLDGPEFTIDVICDKNSKVLAVVPRERLEVKAGISTKGRTFTDSVLEKECARIATELKIIGACNIQCRLVKGVYKFFEVNPRFSGTTPLTIAAGVNGPAILASAALGQKLESYYPFTTDLYMTPLLGRSFPST